MRISTAFAARVVTVPAMPTAAAFFKPDHESFATSTASAFAHFSTGSAAFAKAEKQLGDGPFFAGETLGNVDMAWLPLLHRAALVERHSGYDMLAAYPKVKAWQQAVLATGIAQRSVPDDFTEKFSAFYLSERTWLGRGAKLNEASLGNAQAIGGGCCG